MPPQLATSTLLTIRGNHTQEQYCVKAIPLQSYLGITAAATKPRKDAGLKNSTAFQKGSKHTALLNRMELPMEQV